MISQGSSCECPSVTFSMQEHRNQMMMCVCFPLTFTGQLWGFSIIKITGIHYSSAVLLNLTA